MALPSKSNNPITITKSSFKLALLFVFLTFLNFKTIAKASNDPVFLRENCTTNETFTANSAFQSNLRTLLSSLSSNASRNTEFYNTTVYGGNHFDTVYGLFICWGDVPSQFCRRCVLNAIERLSSDSVCSLSKQAVIWFEECMVRYSNRYFFSTVDISPRFEEMNTINNSNLNQMKSFDFTLWYSLNQVTLEASKSTKKYAKTWVKLSALQSLYTFAQCTPDLSSWDCTVCHNEMIRNGIPWCCLASLVGKVISPSCYLRFELSQVFRAATPPPPLPGPTENREVRSRTIILIIVPTVVMVMLFCFGCYLLRRKAKKSNKSILMENFGDDNTTLESLQFDLAIIEAATNNFSLENRIGKGGFGEVYKVKKCEKFYFFYVACFPHNGLYSQGILPDGRHVAIKRLSRSSRQGTVEFKNEIFLIAKLQHKNLVALIGFCLEEQEKILVYEYVPNKSLDYFLFGSNQQQRLLNWSVRYKIIKGIARGILYLHQYSRLKIIHRDLKPSNVLLDESMNPKVSDFGMARIVAMDEEHGSTNRIVGTYGYMSPEYAMLGQFSEKSDVFSFGVMILEIITGKKNRMSFALNQDADGLLSYAWRQWRDETPLSILDPNLKELYYQTEVMRCIQIGLLCVQKNPDARPTMMTIVSYLSNHSIELPFPQEPAFFMHSRMDPREVAQESSSNQSINNFTTFSFNEMSISKFLPR